jgi:hypothetical protein
MTSHPLIKTTIASAAVLLAVSTPITARADLIQTPAVACHDADLPATTTIGRVSSDWGFGERVNNSGNEVHLFCPVDRFSNIAVNSVTLDGYSNQTSGVTANGCVVYRYGYGGACGGNTSPGATSGVFNMQVPASVWNTNPDDYRVLWIRLKGKVGSSTNALFGYRQN